jgi:hypothetical protein
MALKILELENSGTLFKIRIRWLPSSAHFCGRNSSFRPFRRQLSQYTPPKYSRINSAAQGLSKSKKEAYPVSRPPAALAFIICTHSLSLYLTRLWS